MSLILKNRIFNKNFKINSIIYLKNWKDLLIGSVDNSLGF